MNNVHFHNYTTPKIIRITKVQHNYTGTAGDKAILVRECSCKKYEAFDYGNFKVMVERLKEIKDGSV